jgi:flagellar biosynthesis protein FliR
MYNKEQPIKEQNMKLTEEDHKIIKELKTMGVYFLILVLWILIMVGIMNRVIPETVSMVLAIVCVACLAIPCVVCLGVLIFYGIVEVLGEFWELITYKIPEEIRETKENLVRVCTLMQHLVQRR